MFVHPIVEFVLYFLCVGRVSLMIMKILCQTTDSIYLVIITVLQFNFFHFVKAAV